MAGRLFVGSGRSPDAAVGVLVVVVHVHTRRLVSIHPCFRSSTSVLRELSGRVREVGPGPTAEGFALLQIIIPRYW